MTASPRVVEGTEFGSYRVLRKLGEGGMGAVFEAIHTSIGRHAAVKILHREHSVREDFVQRFFNEARAVNVIDHPALVQIWDFGQTADGTAYMVMEFLRGESLGKRIKRDGTLPIAEALDITRQIASALSAVHERGIVHRDLKPDNIMLVPNADGSGRLLPKLLDFGIAKLMEGKQPGDVQTRTDAVLGTPAYMSPEQCRGANRVDGRADVYSLGVMLYEMLGGRRPFVAEGSGAVFGMHMYEEPMPLRERAPHIPEGVAALVHRLLVKDRNLRPTASETTQLIGQLLDGDLSATPQLPSRSSFRSLLALVRSPGEPSTLGGTAGESTGSGRRRARWLPLTLAAATLGVLLLSGSLLWLRGRSTPSPAAKLPADAPAGPAAAPTPAASPGPRKVVFSISSTPPRAEVVNQQTGEVLGLTPLSHQRLAAPGPVLLLLRQPGYQAVELSLDGDSNHQIERRLSPVPRSGSRGPLKRTSPAATAPPGAAKPGSAASKKPEAPRDPSASRPNLRDILEK
jgi:serine/threonine-protein kinase